MPAPADSTATLVVPNTPALSFSDQCIGDEGVRTLAIALASRRDVTSLDLRGCHLHTAAAVSEILMSVSGQSIGSLSLEWNMLGASDAGPR